MQLVREKVINPLIAVFKQGLTPEALALSFAFGVTGGIFPVPGTTSIICLAFIYLFNLNPAATQIVNLILTPLNLALLLPFMSWGNWLFGYHEDLSGIITSLGEDFLGSLSLAGGSLFRGVVVWAIILAPLTFGIYMLLTPILRATLPKPK